MIPIVTNVEELKKENRKCSIEESKIIIEMLEKSLEHSEVPGIGLAAPQIGIHRKVAIIRIEVNGKKEHLNLINPEIIKKDNGFVSKEGCLSVPNKVANIFRYKEIVLVDELHKGGIAVTGIAAIAVQHEVDHLNGILITDQDIGKKIGRNDPCPCGNVKDGKPVKYKKCHGR